MGLKDLNDIGITDLLLNARIILLERGHTKGVTLHPDSGKVDIRGALLLAAGAKPRNVQGFVTTPEEAKVATYWIPKIYETIDLLEAFYGDIEEWNDNPATTEQHIADALQTVANKLRIAIT